MKKGPTPSGEMERCIEGVDLAVDAYGEDQSIDEWCKLKSFLRSLQKHSQELEAENEVLREQNSLLIEENKKLRNISYKDAKQWSDEGYAKGVSDGYESTRRIKELEAINKCQGDLNNAQTLKILELEEENRKMREGIDYIFTLKDDPHWLTHGVALMEKVGFHQLRNSLPPKV